MAWCLVQRRDNFIFYLYHRAFVRVVGVNTPRTADHNIGIAVKCFCCRYKEHYPFPFEIKRGDRTFSAERFHRRVAMYKEHVGEY